MHLERLEKYHVDSRAKAHPKVKQRKFGLHNLGPFHRCVNRESVVCRFGVAGNDRHSLVFMHHIRTPTA